MVMFLAYGSMVLLVVVGILLMIIILLQRGRGGGLAGAFGGAGGQSAFGTRAGDVFTKITAVMAIIWVFLAGVSRFALEPAATMYAESFQSEEDLRDDDTPNVRPPAGEDSPDRPGDEEPLDEDPAAPGLPENLELPENLLPPDNTESNPDNAEPNSDNPGSDPEND